jgi:hypothetical protein
MDEIANDILRFIFSFLDINSCYNSMFVCKRWLNLIQIPELICLSKINFKKLSKSNHIVFNNEKNTFLQKYIHLFDIILLLKNQPELYIYDEQKLYTYFVNYVEKINKRFDMRNKIDLNNDLNIKEYITKKMLNKLTIDLSIHDMFKIISNVNKGEFEKKYLKLLVNHFSPQLYNTILRNSDLYEKLDEEQLLVMLNDLQNNSNTHKILDIHLSPYYRSRKYSALFYYTYTVNRYLYDKSKGHNIGIINFFIHYDVLSALDAENFPEYVKLIEKNASNYVSESRKSVLIEKLLYYYNKKHGFNVTKNIKLDSYILNYIIKSPKRLLIVYMEYDLCLNKEDLDRIMRKLDIIDIYNCKMLTPEQKKYYIDKKRQL